MSDHKSVRKDKEAEGLKDQPFIITYTKRVFPFKEVFSEDICIEDIAHSLSHLCRFTGHTSAFWSVAQHSLLVAQKMPGGPADKLAALLHDAAEAYTNDLSSPLKSFIWKETPTGGYSPYHELQYDITMAVYQKFGITSTPKEMKKYDQAAGLFEAEAFMGLNPLGLKRYQFPMELWGLWRPWTPKEFASENGNLAFRKVEVEFIRTFEDLMRERG